MHAHRILTCHRGRATVSVRVFTVFGTSLFAQSAAAKAEISDILPLNRVGLPISRYVKSLGSRLQNAGFEQTTLTGTVTRPGQAVRPITITLEHPGRIRVIERDAADGSTAILDDQAHKATSQLTPEQEKIIESTVFDGADYFVFHHTNHGSTRSVGGAFPYHRAAKTARFAVFAKTED